MSKEADFYSPGEAARVLGVTERRIFGMLVSGELKGQQDEYARWRIPGSAIRQVRRALEPATPAMEEDQTLMGSEEATTVAIGSSPPWDSAGVAENEVDTPVAGSEEETTRDKDAAPPESGEESTRKLPGGARGPLASEILDDTGRGMERDPHTRLERVEQERARLEKEVSRLEEENRLLRAKLGAEKDKGVFEKLFGD